MRIRQLLCTPASLALVALGLAACSGSGGAPPAPSPSGVRAGAGTATATFTLTIPSATTGQSRGRRPDYVSAGTTSAAIAVAAAPAGTATPGPGTTTTLACSSGRTCTTQIVAPIGSDLFTVTLSGAKGVLGTGSMTQTIVSATANPVTVTLNGVVASVGLTASPSSLPAGTAATESVVVTAFDASGYTIVAPGGYVDSSGDPLSVSLTRTDYGKGAGTTTATPSPPPAATGPGATFTYAYNGSDIDRTAYAATVSTSAPVTLGTASVDYVPTYVEKYADTAGAITNFIATGPDSKLWFTDFVGGTIGSIVPATGAIVHYAIPSSATNGSAEPEGIVAGPNASMVFAEYASNAIGSISTTTAATLGAATPVTEVNLTTVNANPRGVAYSTTCSPNVWFTEFNGNKIGTLSSTTMTVTEYALAKAGSMPDQIACGPDGNFWFTEYGNATIGRITPAGSITEYPLPAPAAPHAPLGIAAGADGSMWFTESMGDAIGSIATAMTKPASAVGTIVEYPLPTIASPGGTSLAPANIVSAPDGDLFYAETNSENATQNSMIGRITTPASVVPGSVAGSVSSYPLDDASNEPFGITVGPDGHIWYTEQGGSAIGYLIY